jgi:hypothetical protein
LSNPGTPDDTADEAKAIVRRNTEKVQGEGDFALFDELFADDFVDHTPQPGTTPDKAGVRVLYTRLREAFPDFRPEIRWQSVEGDLVTTYKIYHGTHLGEFLGIPPTGRTIQFETGAPRGPPGRRRCHARTPGQDYRPLGCRQPLLGPATTRTAVGHVVGTRQKKRGTPGWVPLFLYCSCQRLW